MTVRYETYTIGYVQQNRWIDRGLSRHLFKILTVL